nr:MAG TPA: minor tail protein [Caudoviricetes sp.]
MSGYSQVRGISVKIDGDTTGFQKAVNKIKSETAGLDKTMSKLKSSMKFNEGDFQSFATYQNLLQDKIKSTTKQLEVYNKKLMNYPKTQKQWADAVSSATKSVDNYTHTFNSLNKEYTNNSKQINAWKEAIANGTRSAEQGETAIQRLASRNVTLKEAMDDCTSGIAEQKKVLVDLGSTYEDSQRTYLGLKAGALGLKNELAGMSNSFISTNETLLRLYDTLGKVSSKAEQFANAVKPLSMLSFAGIAAATKTAIDFEDAWTGVTKTVNGTPQQFEKINAGLKDLAQNTSSTYQDIAHYAELAGQMGIPTDSIVGFTKTITQLGDTTNLVGEEAAQSIAKFSNVMVSQSKKTNTYYSRLGSTIVDLGNKFSTTESDIMDMATRLGVAGKMVGFNSNQVLGLSTALSSLGIEAAAGGSSVSKMLKKIDIAVSTGDKNLSKFAEVSGMTSQQFQKSWGEDAAGTFLKFVEGIGKSSDVTKTLNDLGITEVRQAQSMGALAQSSDVLANALNVSKNAWNDNSAMANEAEKRYATLKSQLSQTWEAIKQAGNELGQAFTPTLTDLLKIVKKAANAFSNLDEGTQQTIAKMLLLTAAAYPTAKGVSKVAGATQGAVKFFTKAHPGLQKVADGFGDAAKAGDLASTSIISLGKGFVLTHPAITAVTVALGAFAGAVVWADKKRKEAMETANKELAYKDTDYAVTLKVIDGYDKYAKSMTKTKNSMGEIVTQYTQNNKTASHLMQTIEDLNAKESLNATQKTMLAEAVRELNQLYPDLGVEIDENTGKLNLNEDANYKSIDAIKERITQLQEEAKQEALASIAKKNAAAQLKAEMKNAELTESINSTTDSLRKLSLQFAAGHISMQDYMNQSSALKESISTLCTDLADSYTKLHETQTQSILQSNYLETQSFEQMGTTMKAQLTDIAAQAAQSGIQIPLGIQEGITNGTANAVEAANYMATLMNMNQLVDQAGMIGGSIPTSVANGILANCGSISEATNAMNNLITLANAVKSAGMSGEQIPTDVATAVANGQMSVSDAVTKMMSDTDPTIKKAGEKMLKESQNSITGIADAFANDGTTSSAVGKMGGKMEKSLQPHLDGMVTSSAKAYSDIKSNIDKAQSYADSHPITVTHTTIKKTRVVEGDDNKKYFPQSLFNADKPVVDTDIMPMDADKIATYSDISPYASVANATTAIMGGTTSRSYGSVGNINLSAITNRLDQMINAIGNCDLTINLQPMQLDGNVVTDTVQEIISIRDMLKSWGNGGS